MIRHVLKWEKEMIQIELIKGAIFVSLKDAWKISNHVISGSKIVIIINV